MSLFDTARPSITYHTGNIFKEGKLDKVTSAGIFARSKKRHPGRLCMIVQT